MGTPFTLGPVRILEIADDNVSYCGRLLAAFGADVILVEPPGGGRLRVTPPFVREGPMEGTSVAAAYLHMGKHSVTLDLRTGDGQALFRGLTRETDIVLDGGKPGRLEQWGLGYSRLAEINRGIIVAAITPFGQDGPYRGYRANAAVAFAMGGLMYVSGPQDGPPVVAPGNHGNIVAGAHGAMAILTALRARTRSGWGQHIDVAIQATFAAQENLISAYTGEGQSTRRVGIQHRVATPGRVYQCRDGWVHFFVSPAQAGAWDRLQEWMGFPPEFQGEKWQDARYRRAQAPIVDEVVSQWVRQFNKQDLYEEAQRRKIPCAPVNTVGEFLHDTHTQVRDFVQNTAGSSEARYSSLACPWTLDGRRPPALAPVPAIGESNEWIYRDVLRLSSDDLERLRALRVV